MLTGALSVLALSSGTAQAALINSYDFDGDLTDTLGAGNDLTSGGGTITGGRYDFGLNQGLRLTDALNDTSDFAIELGFKATDSTAGYKKLIDFQDLSTDHGLYILNGKLRFYTASASFGSISLGTDYTVGLERSGGLLSIFLDNIMLVSVADGGNQAVSADNILNFFEDDAHTGGGEAFEGSVDFIRIHDDASTFGDPPVSPVPLPASALLLGAALTGLAATTRRRRKKQL